MNTQQIIKSLQVAENKYTKAKSKNLSDIYSFISNNKSNIIDVKIDNIGLCDYVKQYTYSWRTQKMQLEYESKEMLDTCKVTLVAQFGTTKGEYKFYVPTIILNDILGKNQTNNEVPKIIKDFTKVIKPNKYDFSTVIKVVKVSDNMYQCIYTNGFLIVKSDLFEYHKECYLDKQLNEVNINVYPSYQNINPVTSNYFEVDKKNLQNRIKSLKSLINNDEKAVSFNIGNNICIGESKEFNTKLLIDSNDIKINRPVIFELNYEYLNTILNTIPGKTVKIEFEELDKPFRVNNNILMPVVQ